MKSFVVGTDPVLDSANPYEAHNSERPRPPPWTELSYILKNAHSL